MKVSVIVPNHGRDITVLKNSLPPDVELIHINRGLERSAQRNIGIKEATGEALLILDSDQSISPGLIEECIGLMAEGYSCIYIPEIIVAKSWFGKVRAFERTFYTGTAIDVPRFVRAAVCPKFDVDLIGPEDADWANKLRIMKIPAGNDIDISPGAVNYVFKKLKFTTSERCLYHHDDLSIWEYFRKKSFYAKSMRKYAEKWPNDKCLDWKYRCFGVFVENGKWKKIIRHPLLSLGVLTIIFIRGIIYVRR